MRLATSKCYILEVNREYLLPYQLLRCQQRYILLERRSISTYPGISKQKKSRYEYRVNNDSPETLLP